MIKWPEIYEVVVSWVVNGPEISIFRFHFISTDCIFWKDEFRV